MSKKRSIRIVLILCTLIGIFSIKENIKATSAEQKKEEAEENLGNVENQIENIENQQQEVKEEITKVKQELTQLFAKQEKLEVEISQTQAEIDQTEVDLALAREEEQNQYESMKVRIQYMYENSTEDSLWEAIIGAKGISDLLNRVEYVTMVHNADRDLTEQYKAAVAAVEEKEAQLQEEMQTLLAKQEVFLGQQADIEEMVSKLEGEQVVFAQQLASAQEQAQKYQQIIEEQDEIIRQEEERRRAEEEARKKAEEEAKKKAEEEAKKKAEEEAKKKAEEEAKKKAEEEAKKKAEEEAKKEEAAKKEEESKKEEAKKEEESKKEEDKKEDNKKEEETKKEDNKKEESSSVTGQQIVNYALKFVGNPYVWGGNSLTSGVDCSGFVHLVYKNFGYNLPRYSMSFLNVGTSVSLSNIKVGDIVVYTKKNGVGHVAIYAGNGKIVEAQSAKTGITSNRKVDCREIAGIRRIIN